MTSATLLSTCSGDVGQRCGYVPHFPTKSYELEQLVCRGEPAYEVTSRGHPDLPGLRPLRFLVCLEHAPEVRLMEWLESIRTYAPPVRHVFSCRYGYAPCSCGASADDDSPV